MRLIESRNDTIAAIATSTGGAVGIVRVSGSAAAHVAETVVAGWPPTPSSHRLYYGHLVDADHGLADEIMAVLMRGPRSFTGEDVLEVHCHGGATNLPRVLEIILAAGCRQAAP